LSLIEPAIMIFMGCFVTFVLVALYLPIFSLADTLKMRYRNPDQEYKEWQPRHSLESNPAGRRNRAGQGRSARQPLPLRVRRPARSPHRSRPVPFGPGRSDVPLQLRADQGQNGHLDIALADPRNLNLIDELAILLQKKLHVKVATLSQISDLLKKTEQSQRVLEEVTEGFTLDVIGEEENQDETLSIDKLTADSDIAPVIKLVDTTIFNALERRASDIHIETRDQEVAIKYRIDGVLHYAMPPISRRTGIPPSFRASR
jgi:hypothetical protein